MARARKAAAKPDVAARPASAGPAPAPGNAPAAIDASAGVDAGPANAGPAPAQDSAPAAIDASAGPAPAQDNAPAPVDLRVPVEASAGVDAGPATPGMIGLLSGGEGSDGLDLTGRDLVVRSASGRTFRRAGHVFGKEPLIISVDTIGLDAAAAILAEDALVVELVLTDAPAG